MTPLFPFDNSYARLPERFFARLPPAPVAAPRLLKLNEALAAELGLDATALASREGVAALAGNALPAGSEPIALAYAGHQFGGFVPQLGDGRAILLGEIVDRQGRRRDVQLKGSGRTPFSRNGDGRAAIGPVLREYLVSEAMAALGVPTTRSLAAVATGERVYRESALPGAVLTRIAASHIRIGTFQYFAARGDTEGLRLLLAQAIARHDPDAAGAENPALAFLAGVVARQAALVARWLDLGFIHGVMNTDNMSVSGETIDYGPCAFMDAYHPETVFSSIDRLGRYAYRNQPAIALWNLSRLAECLLPLIDDDLAAAAKLAEPALEGFRERFEAARLAGLRRKLGLERAEEDDGALARDLLALMADEGVDYTLAFRRLAAAEIDEAPLRALFAATPAFDGWLDRWRVRLARETVRPAERRVAMLAANPLFIPRNHRVEAALAAAESGDLAPFETLLAVVLRPFDDQPENAAFAEPPKPEERVLATFCGT